MSPKIKNTPEFQKKLQKAAKEATTEFRDVMADTAQKIARDQADWLDKIMCDILPPKLYEAGKHGDLLSEIEAHMERHGFRLIFIPDAMVLRMMRGSNVHAEFVPQITVDGIPIKSEQTSFTDVEPSNN